MPFGTRDRFDADLVVTRYTAVTNRFGAPLRADVNTTRWPSWAHAAKVAPASNISCVSELERQRRVLQPSGREPLPEWPRAVMIW